MTESSPNYAAVYCNLVNRWEGCILYIV